VALNAKTFGRRLILGVARQPIEHGIKWNRRIPKYWSVSY